MQLTARDISIIRAVHEYRLLSSDQITKLVEGSKETTKRRLALLFHNGYLDRIDPKRFLAFEEGSHPFVYALGNAGSDLLADRYAVPRPASNWTAKNKKLKQLFFRHTLMVSTILLSLKEQCESRNMRMIPWREILEEKAPAATRERKDPARWSVSVPGKGDTRIEPDAIFGFEYLDKPAGKNRAFFFLEADRATMPVLRSNFTISSIYRKLLAYHQTAVQKIHTRRLGIGAFRVLFITESPEGRRVESMMKVAKRLPSHHAYFLFAEMRGDGGFVFRDCEGSVVEVVG